MNKNPIIIWSCMAGPFVALWIAKCFFSEEAIQLLNCLQGVNGAS